MRKTEPLHLALVGLTAGWQASIQNMGGFQNLEIQVKLFGFFLFYSSAMLVIMLEVHFSLLFLNKAYFRVYFVVCKIRFFHADIYY